MLYGLRPNGLLQLYAFGGPSNALEMSGKFPPIRIRVCSNSFIWAHYFPIDDVQVGLC